MTKIVTHNGKFHPDDVFAIASLLLLYPEAQILRTRDPEVIKKADIVVDVGMLADESKNYFDHHQAEGAGVRDNGVPYASFGLVWRAFGEKICDSKSIQEVIDSSLVQQVDAADNGVDLFSSKVPGLFPYSIGSAIDLFRPTWKEDMNWDKNFFMAVNWAKDILGRYIQTMKDLKEGQNIVLTTYQQSKNKQLIEIDKKYDFGRELIVSVLVDFPEPLYAIFFRHDAQNWCVVCNRVARGSFESRKPFPVSWGGKRDKELEEITGVKGAIFCHRNLFMCLADTKESALSLAEIALKS